jgi:thioredoxin 1
MLHTATQDTYQDEVVTASQEQPVLVDFWGPACVPCRQMLPWVEELAERTAGSLKIVKVNAEENRKLCMDLRVGGLPTAVIYHDGAEVQRLSGPGCNPRTIAEALRQVTPALANV